MINILLSLSVITLSVLVCIFVCVYLYIFYQLFIVVYLKFILKTGILNIFQRFTVYLYKLQSWLFIRIGKFSILLFFLNVSNIILENILVNHTQGSLKTLFLLLKK